MEQGDNPEVPEEESGVLHPAAATFAAYNAEKDQGESPGERSAYHKSASADSGDGAGVLVGVRPAGLHQTVQLLQGEVLVVAERGQDQDARHVHF